MSAVPFLDLGPSLDALRPDLDAAVQRVIASRSFILGPELEAFEQEFAAFCGVRHAIGTASGTDALELALRAAGVGPGHEVVTVSHTFIATPLAVLATGATPVFVDVRPEDGLMDPDAAAAAITERTRAILPVHLYGRCADTDALGELAAHHGVALVEDAAQAHGAVRGSRRAGSLGDLGCFSFYPTKNLGALGDGGAVVTDDDTLAESVRLLRNYGQTRKYHHERVGRNSRLDELQAAVLRVKLPHLDGWNARRRALARRYGTELAGTGVRTPKVGDGDVVHLYAVHAPDRDALQQRLATAGVATQVHYPIPAHRQAAMRDVARPFPLEVTERLADETLSLPMYPELAPQALLAVARAARGE